MPGTPDERYMQKHIVEYLCSQPIVDASGNVTDQMEYHEVSPTEYDKDSCLIPSELFAFLKASASISQSLLCSSSVLGFSFFFAFKYGSVVSAVFNASLAFLVFSSDDWHAPQAARAAALVLFMLMKSCISLIEYLNESVIQLWGYFPEEKSTDLIESSTPR